MRGNPLEITGQVWNGITAIKRTTLRSGRAFKWEFKCHCGKLFYSRPIDIKTGGTNSCGCSRQGGFVSTLGREDWLIYLIWVEMRQRCNNLNNPSYHRYGGRGIKVSPEWNDFPTFLKDMGPKPTPEHTLERNNNNAGYSKDNCRWATRIENNNNRRPRSS